MDNPQDIELIVRVYEGDASEAERALFAQKSVSDPTFRAAAERHREAVEIMQRLAEREKIRKLLRQENARLGPVKDPPADEDNKKTPAPFTWNIRTISRLAAAAAFAGLLVWLLWPKPPSAPELFAQHFHPEKLKRGGDTPPTTVFERYLDHFDRERYDSCASLFPLLPDTVKAYRKVQLLQANALLATGQNVSAVELLQNLVAQNAPESQDAQWLLALAYLQANNVEAAHAELAVYEKRQGLARSEKERAGELLKQVNRLR